MKLLYEVHNSTWHTQHQILLGRFSKAAATLSCRKHNSFKKGAANGLREGHLALVHFYLANISGVASLREKIISASLETSCLFCPL